MKKLLNIVLLILCAGIFIQRAGAVSVNEYVPQKLPVKLGQTLSSDRVPSHFYVVTDKYYKVSDDNFFDRGTVFYLQTVKISPPKVGKQDGYIEAKITKIYIPNQNKTITVTNPDATVKLSVYKTTDYTDKGIDAGIKVANHYIKNITIPAQFVRGTIENETGDRLESGAKMAYKKSSLSYVEKGQPVCVKAGELATMTFVVKDTK